jgi:hypothetical protein
MEGLMLWLQADRDVMQVNGGVSLWRDQSGNHKDAVQSVSDARPSLAAAGIGNRPSVQFDGVDDFLKVPTGFADFTQGLSVFATVQIQPVSFCDAIVELSNGSEMDDINLGQAQNQIHYEVFDRYFDGDLVPTGASELIEVVHHPNLMFEMRLNGTLAGEGSSDLPANVPRQQNFLGKSLYAECGPFSGQLSELILYGREVYETELLKIEDHMRAHSACCSQ